MRSLRDFLPPAIHDHQPAVTPPPEMTMKRYDAQQPAKVHRIGILRVGPPPRSFLEPLQKGLRELGYIEGQNLTLSTAWRTTLRSSPILPPNLSVLRSIC